MILLHLYLGAVCAMFYLCMAGRFIGSAQRSRLVSYVMIAIFLSVFWRFTVPVVVRRMNIERNFRA